MRMWIEQMRFIYGQLTTRNRQLNELTKPTLTDYGLLPYIWSEFVAFSKSKGHKPLSSAYERKKFLFVVLMFYSPLSIVGGRLKNGLRDALINTIGKVKGATISYNLRNVDFYYENYKDFSSEVDYFCAEICEKLGKKLPRRS